MIAPCHAEVEAASAAWLSGTLTRFARARQRGVPPPCRESSCESAPVGREDGSFVVSFQCLAEPLDEGVDEDATVEEEGTDREEAHDDDDEDHEDLEPLLV